MNSQTKLLLQSLSTQLHLIQETLYLLKVHLQNTSLLQNITENDMFLQNLNKPLKPKKELVKKLSDTELDALYTRRLEKETSW
jgi:hypothetical protein